MQPFEYFSGNQIQHIHETTLRVLETVGVDFAYGPALEVFKAAGCKLDGRRVFFKPNWLEEQIKKAPSQFKLHARNPEHTIDIGGEHIAYIPCYGPPFVTDLDRGRRESTLEDYINFIKLAHSSVSMDVSGGMLAEPNDVPHDRRNAEMISASMRYSDKPFMGGAIGSEAARETIEMAALLFECSEADLADRPPMVSILCSKTPLGFDDRMLGAIMEYARAGMPQLISSLSIAGATSPVTLEGTLVVQNAEILAGIALTQLLREGTPVIFAGSSSSAAMRYGSLSIGAPEMAVNTAATAQLARFYGIPSRGGGALTDSKLPDVQAGYEAMMSQLMATLSGIHFVLHSAGILEGYMVSSYEKFVIDDEICGMCKRIKRGEKADSETLAYDVIKEIGPGGEYLTHAHTFRHFREELYAPILEEKSTYDKWSEDGRISMEQRANRKWKEILDAYSQPELQREIDQALNQYIQRKYGS